MKKVARSFYQLPPAEQQLLGLEMALSGVAQQTFTLAEPPPPAAGPAFLVYYSPAFVRTAMQSDARAALSVLAEVYRGARALWPLLEADAGRNVTVRIDQLKSLSAAQIAAVHAEGACWVAVRKNTQEALIERCALSALPALLAAGPCEVLRLWGEAIGIGAEKQGG